MTLSQCFSETTATVIEGSRHKVVFDGYEYFDNDPIFTKIEKALNKLQNLTGFKKSLAIETHNSFPHGCGIASSASGMAALTLASVSAWTNSSSFDELHEKGWDREKLAHLARRCSGSAGRSLYGGFVKWERGEARDAQLIHGLYEASHWRLSNIVAVVNNEPKKTSSSDGHLAAPTSRYFKLRLASLKEREERLLEALQNHDLRQFGSVIEEDALEMHKVMQTSVPPIDYLSEDSLELIEWIRTNRSKGLWQAYFTIDAGPNIHILHREEDSSRILSDLQESFPQHRYIKDRIGEGPQIVRNNMQFDTKPQSETVVNATR